MNSDNIVLNKKHTYSVLDFDTKKPYAEGFTNRKSAIRWMKENKKEGVHWFLAVYSSNKK